MNGIIRTLQKNTWLATATIWVVGLVFAFVNFYIASKLAPLTAHMDSIDQKVDAIIYQHESIRPEIAAQQQEIKDISANLKQIQQTEFSIYNLLIK